MKRLLVSLSIASLAVLGTVAAVAAAGPTATPGPYSTPAPAATPAPVATTAPVVRGPATGTISGLLGMTQAEVQALRVTGKSLAQIAQSKGINPQVLVDALVAQWGARIDARVATGALTADQAATLKANLVTQATAMVNQTALGGMRGSAVGAGPGAMGGGMRGNGNGAQGGVRGNGMGNGMGRGAAGTGTCPLATAAPQS